MTDLIGLGIQSADGRWEWDGQAWRPMSASGAARPPEPRTPSPPRVRYDPSPRPVIGAPIISLETDAARQASRS